MTVDTRRSVDDPAIIPDDLRCLGFRLITDSDDSMYAVSARWGVSARKTTLDEVWTAARRLVEYLRWMEGRGLK